MSASASAGASAAPSASAEPSAQAATNLNLTIPPGGYARLSPDAGGGYLAVAGLTKPLGPGSEIYVTFTFDADDPVGVTVPYGVPLTPPSRVPGSHAGEE